MLSPVAFIGGFENRLLDRLTEEAGAETVFQAEEFLLEHWMALWTDHPLLDGLPLPGDRIEMGSLEQDLLRWDDPEASEEVVLDCLDALQELVGETFEQMLQTWGEKKALQVYRKEYEATFQPDTTAEMMEDLSLLALAR